VFVDILIVYCALQPTDGAQVTITEEFAMSIAQEFEAANKQYVSQFSKGDLPMPPGRKAAVLVCMDARIDPARALGLEEGDVHVIRNAGGRAKDALRSLAISQELLGTREIVVIHHTDCGMLTFTNDVIRERLAESLGQEAASVANGLDFEPFPDVDQSVIDDVEAIKASPIVRDVPISGYVYDVKTGALNRVV
jgi:carbonic anhydrase